MVWNKQTTRITYLLVSPHPDGTPPATTVATLMYAIHPSYFYFAQSGEGLVFSRKIGNDDPFLLELPERYDSVEVRDLRSFLRYTERHAAVASHRSDYE